MKLRGRFTLTLAIAALVPITVAAVVTRQVVAASLRDDYQDTRRGVQAQMQRELDRLAGQVVAAVSSLVAHNHPFVGAVLDLVANPKEPAIALDELHALREAGPPVMRGLSLDVLTIIGPDNAILIAAHYRGRDGEDAKEVRKRAEASTAAYFGREPVFTGGKKEVVLVAQAAQIESEGTTSIAVMAGRRLGEDMLAAVRRPERVDARIVTPTGEVLLPAAKADWATLTNDPPIRIPLIGVDGAPVAVVEIAVSDGDLAGVLRNVTLVSTVLAAGALGTVVLFGLLVARTMARDLDQLVAGSMAAARGELDHRVPVRSADEIGAVANAFNLMMEDLRTAKDRLVIAERIAAWQEIARRLAHEIKNPLTPIQMAMDTLRKTWRKRHPSFDEILEESTATVLEEADRLKRLVAEFSDFARMPKPELGRVDLNEVVRSGLALYQNAMPLELQLAPKLPQLDADRGQLNQVLLNLVENGRDAIGQLADPALGKIRVTTKLGEAGDRVLLIVEDNGPGIPGDLKDKVFAPYFTTKHAKGGTGLGLAIVHRIVSDHGGRISIGETGGSRDGGKRVSGARFTIELPLRDGTSLLASRTS